MRRTSCASSTLGDGKVIIWFRRIGSAGDGCEGIEIDGGEHAMASSTDGAIAKCERSLAREAPMCNPE